MRDSEEDADERQGQDKDKPADKRDGSPTTKSKGQYGGMDGLGPGGGEGFDKVERPARPDDDRLPDPKD
jgi:hypothetical protein